jgi:hypothetical protein
MIRVLLFSHCLEPVTGTTGKNVWDAFREFDSMRRTARISQWTEQMRYMFGEKFEQKNHGYKCLDYAITRHSYAVDEQSDVRLLAGERNFLYQCFCRIFREEFNGFETNLFYVYLLIKSNFRSELIQNNRLVGFANFADYQDRKNQFFEELDEYWTESQRLSVAMAVRKGNIVSLETRIMPKASGKLLHSEIHDLDSRAETALEGVTDTFYYTIHFPKIPFDRKEYENRISKCPRNVVSRNKAEKSARAIASYLRSYSGKGKAQRVYGIDACSKEIGCRPEVFATEFRYIRECSREQTGKNIRRIEEGHRFRELGITYHVGEDFLDITDGLRAIDEAVQFLELRRD